ncbi:hypothetical protein DMENIID0001_154260 [Sergentomyia squamirostris]
MDPSSLSFKDNSSCDRPAVPSGLLTMLSEQSFGRKHRPEKERGFTAASAASRSLQSSPSLPGGGCGVQDAAQ